MNKVAVPWKQGDTISSWNNVCAQIVEKFGLPGNRYTTEVSADWMGFVFKDEKDALLCRLMISEHI